MRSRSAASRAHRSATPSPRSRPRSRPAKRPWAGSRNSPVTPINSVGYRNGKGAFRGALSRFDKLAPRGANRRQPCVWMAKKTRGKHVMKPESVRSLADAKKIVEERGITHIKVGVFDIDGVLRGKYISKAKFLSALESGFGFCDVVLGWDSNDQLYDNTKFTGWHTAYPDALVRLIPESCREIPFEENTLFFLGQFVERAEAVCPRGLL